MCSDAGANVAVFGLWQMNPEFASFHFLVSPQHIRDGRVHTLLTAGGLDIVWTCCVKIRQHLLRSILRITEHPGVWHNRVTPFMTIGV